jgi:hypothetical protein
MIPKLYLLIAISVCSVGSFVLLYFFFKELKKFPKERIKHEWLLVISSFVFWILLLFFVVHAGAIIYYWLDYYRII